MYLHHIPFGYIEKGILKICKGLEFILYNNPNKFHLILNEQTKFSNKIERNNIER